MPKVEPTLSFIIPVHKKPVDVFEGCLRSIFDQSLKNIEVICVFDGQDDELQAVTAKYPKVKGHVIEHGGAPKARNYGLEQATGKYVVFWDADCFIKPDSAKRWLEEFDAVLDADFVYTGYELSEGQGTFDAEPFNRYSLECGNYICTMSPIKRDKAFKWDETLEAAQDWDYWLTATERGLKGVWVEGHAFVTIADRDGISMKGLSGPDRDAIITQIHEKHGIPDRTIGVYSAEYRERAIKLAKILGADLIKPTGHTPTVYKTILNIGYNQFSRFDGVASDVTKIQYWVPGEIAGLEHAQYKAVMETIRIAKGVKNLCGTQYEANKLSDLGITAEVAPLPLAEEEIEKVATDLPKDFTILVATDKAYAELLKDLKVDLPHIKIIYNAAKVADFSCFLSFYQFAALDNAMLMAHVNGRNVISNVQEPMCGFIDPDQTWESFKAQLYQKIREVKGKDLNKAAQDYYLQLSNPQKFRDKITGYTKTVLEVLA